MSIVSLSRRKILGTALLATGFGIVPRALAAQAPTPSCADDDEPTLSQIEGPFFKPRSPLRADLVEPNARAPAMALDGLVLTRSCRPVGNALLELWHADERGEYDESGYRYRGHAFSDASGRFRFRTIVPAPYSGRTRHYHFKVQAPQRRVLTTQLYFPGERMNDYDSLFDPALLMRVSDQAPGKSGYFDFVLDIA